MSLLYSASTSKHGDTSVTWLERQLTNVCGRSLKKNDIENLNVQYFNEDIFKILLQLYSILYNEYFPNDIKHFKIVDLFEPTIFEPIFHMVDQNHNVIHIFNRQQIRTYFNFQEFGKTSVVKQLDSCRKYLLEVKPTGNYYKISDPIIDCITLNELQSMNFVKLYILCDHALEHLHYYTNHGIDDQNFDLTHQHFGKSVRFLSSLITEMPKKPIDEIVYDRSMKVIEEMFKIRWEECNGEDESTSDNV
jgi:hypothetical protein